MADDSTNLPPNPNVKLHSPHLVRFADGDFTGADGAGGNTPPGAVCGFSPTSYAFWQVPELTPAAAERPPLIAPSSKRLVYINGINTRRRDHAYTLKLITVVTGARVIGIYNQSGDGGEDTDMLGDLWQSAGDKFGFSNNPTTNTLEKAIFDACRIGVHLNIIAHSQGAIITSRGTRNAIKQLKNFYGRQDNETRLAMERADRNRNVFERVFTNAHERRDELMRERIMPIVERALNSYVTIQTFGGAASFFPDGPVYRHVLNYYDGVATLFGRGNPIHGSGRGARTELLHRDSGSPGREFSADHSIDLVYMQPSQHYVDLNDRRVDNNYIPIDMNMVR